MTPEVRGLSGGPFAEMLRLVKIGKYVLLGLCLAGSAALAQQDDRMILDACRPGQRFRSSARQGKWGIEIAGPRPAILQPKPARLEIFRTDEDILQIAAGYGSIEIGLRNRCPAEIAYGEDVVFRVQDRWSMSGAVLSVSRKVEVKGNAQGGFYSAVVLTVDPAVGWSDMNCLAPGALYGDPTYDGERSPGGTQNNAARRFLMREDILPAPLFAISFNNGASVAILDPAPRGDTTLEETKLAKPVITDARLQFGALGAWQAEDNAVEFGFWFPVRRAVTRAAPVRQRD
jgi:hypothetical protein